MGISYKSYRSSKIPKKNAINSNSQEVVTENGIKNYVDSHSSTASGTATEWDLVSSSSQAVEGHGYLVDTSAGEVTLTLPSSPSTGDKISIVDLKGTFDTHKCIVARNSNKIMSLNEDLELINENNSISLVYSNSSEGWRVVDSTPLSSDENSVINAPLLHIQEQQPNGTNAGNSVSGMNQRTLNTVVTNEISGASLSSNMVTLPAGTYWLECNVPGWGSGAYHKLLIRDASDNNLLFATGPYLNNGTANNIIISDRLSLTTTTTIKVVHYISSGATDGLGRKGDNASATGAPEVYTDLKIWRLDQKIQTPVVAKPPNTVVSGVLVTGNIMGLDYEMSSGSPDDTVVIKPGSCMDDTLQEEIILTSNTNLVLSSPNINTIYHLFVTKTSGVVGVAYDSDENGVNVTADYKRWVGFVRTNSSGDICKFVMQDNLYFNTRASESIAIDSITTTSTFALIDISNIVPINRINGVIMGAKSNNTSTYIVNFSSDGIGTGMSIAATPSNWASRVDDGDSAFLAHNYSNATIMLYNSGLYINNGKETSGSVKILVRGATLKR